MNARWIGFFTVVICAIATGCPSPSDEQPASPPLANASETEQEQLSIEIQSDVVIVGAGISGLSAALELGRAGAEVNVIDMSSVYGGHAVMSQGGVSVVDTPLQAAAGWDDSPDLAYGDFIRWGEDADEEWVRYYVDHSREDIYDWLIELGVQFEGVDTAPGNSVDRFHQPAGRGIGLVTPIYRACLEYPNIHFYWNVKAAQLEVRDERVVGVLTNNMRTREEQSFRADAVILATGGFQSNLEMVREFWPQEFRFPKRILAGSGRNSVGFGHRLAQQIGADLVKMDHQWNYFTGIPDPLNPGTDHGLSAANMYGIIVNPDGKRFANLHNWAKEVMPPMLAQDDATLWFIFDEGSKKEFVISGTDWADFNKVDKLVLQNPDLVQTADTLDELARKAGLPAKNLVEAIRRYNSLVEQGADTDFERFGPDKTEYNNTASPKIETPPYYAMQAFPLTRKSMGGVAIDRSCRVLTKDRKPIAGLYAVGELTGLAGINGKAALEGTFLGPCIVTGRVAGRSILRESPQISAAEATDDNRCVTCHDVEALIAEDRPGYWHFERSHTIALKRGIDCRQCHAELAPYREDDHRMNAQVLTTTCVSCHVAQE
jgi:flavocytochrome c